MRIAPIVVLALGLLAGSCLSGKAQTTQNGPYYANPSWDQQLPSATRFVVLSNWGRQAVLDRETGLVWEVAPNLSGADWHNANLGCLQRTTGGRFGWRLPRAAELITLLDPNAAPPNIVAGSPFPSVSLVEFWTSSADEIDPTQAYALIINFSGAAIVPSPESDAHAIWCVRSGAT